MLFILKDFVSHSGLKLDWKIDCDALTDEDIETCAWLIAEKLHFGSVVGIPSGGIRLAKALEKYISKGPVLIVDDVLTTGQSMKKVRQQIQGDTIGVVIFARNRPPEWITPLFLCCI